LRSCRLSAFAIAAFVSVVPLGRGTARLERQVQAHSNAWLAYVPVAACEHPVAVCRGVIGREAAIENAIREAGFEGLGPPPGHDEMVVHSAELMTAAEHDARYSEEPIVQRGIPIVEPWDCYWRVDLDVYGWWLPSRAGSRPWLATWFWALVHADNGEINTWELGVARETPETPAETATPAAEPTAWATPRPTPTSVRDAASSRSL
jgi:hypothetical protein